MGPGRRPRVGLWLRTPTGPVRSPPLSPAPRPRSFPAARPRRGQRRPALPRVRSSGTFSSPLSFRPARNRHTDPIRIRGQASGGRPGSGQSPACSLRPGPGGGKCQGWRAPSSGDEGCSELTSYSEILQRAAAADRRHIDGFQSQHRKPRPIAREPLPLPARLTRPQQHLPRPSAAAGGRRWRLRTRRAASSVPTRSRWSLRLRVLWFRN